MDTKSMSIAVIAAMDSTTTTALWNNHRVVAPVDHEIDIRAVLCDGLLGLCDRRGRL